MKFIVRLILTGIALYILLSLGLIEVFVALLIQVGKVIMNIASINPTAAAIGVLLLILMTGSRYIEHDSKNKR